MVINYRNHNIIKKAYLNKEIQCISDKYPACYLNRCDYTRNDMKTDYI